MVNPTAASLLGFLHTGPKTGWELTSQIELSIGNFWNVTRSQVYRELSSLAASSLVVAGVPGRRDRRPYEITEKGKEAFREWINREPGDELIRDPVLLMIFFREHVDPDRLVRFLTAHRLRHERRLEQYETLEVKLRGIESGPLDTLHFGIAYEHATLGWLDELLVRARTEAAAPSER